MKCIYDFLISLITKAYLFRGFNGFYLMEPQTARKLSDPALN